MSDAPKKLRKATPHRADLIQNDNIGTAPLSFEAAFEALTDGVLICDTTGKILYMNRAALQLFGVPASAAYKGKPYQCVLGHCTWYDENHQPLAPDQLPLAFVLRERTMPQVHERTLIMRSPAGREVSILCSVSPLFDAHKHLYGTICLFHDVTKQHQHAHQIYSSYQALSTLIQAIAHIPKIIDTPHEDNHLLLSKRTHTIEQHLVDLIRQVLDCDWVFLFSIGPENRVYYVATSGLTQEQEQRRMQINGRYTMADFLDESTIARLYNNETVIMPHHRITLPFTDTPDLDTDLGLFTPIISKKQFVGNLLIGKSGYEQGYTAEEITLAETTAMLTVMVMECIHTCDTTDKERAKALVQQEAYSLIDEFLNSASHELRTPLTVVIGNIQLASRRLQSLNQQLANQPEAFAEKLPHIQQSLEHASQGAYTIDILLNMLIADVQIHRNTLTLHMKRFDLVKMVHQVVARQQTQASEYTIQIDTDPQLKTLMVVADMQRIQQVITIYLLNALMYTSLDRPVTVRVERRQKMAYVAVHDDGPAISPDEQQEIWHRFTRPRAPVYELDWSLGLGLYTCKEFIQRHHVEVGLESAPDAGATFWFTLPLPEENKATKP
ncbi:MAG TPA: PAS domain-containing sensor histidine kinase, partial [Ktedonobacteraceae bacterium]|nr:PAS domain-containing sensor histidine kinase [Ktedonobacteraceae bacterium]